MSGSDLASLDAWLAELADRTPTPGGGAVAALCGALSAALIGMVTSYTTGEKWADRHERMQARNAEAAKLRAEALSLVERDIAAFDAVSAAYRMPKQTPEEKVHRSAAIQSALVQAADPPVQVADLARRLVDMAEELIETGNPNVLSDVAVASATARAALDNAAVNIQVNLAQIRDDAEHARLAAVLASVTASAQDADRVTNQVRERIG